MTASVSAPPPFARRVLVVDDDRTMVKTLADILGQQGWIVSTAHSGAEAVNSAATQRFDVVLMDIKMPGIDGVDAFKAIRKQQPNVRVVLMTAYAAPDRLAEAERAGVLRIMPKPVNLAELLDLIARENPQSILLIDNDPSFLRTLSDVLRLQGFDTVVAYGIDQALKFLADTRPAAIMLHVHLGSVSPPEAVSAVHHKSPAVALILYSGKAEAKQEVKSVPAEWIRAYLQKPFDAEQVTGVLNAICASG